VVDNYFHTVALVVFIDFDVRGLVEFAEHIRRQEGRSTGTPVVMVEEGVGFPILANRFRVFEFVFCNIVDQFVHQSGFFIEVDHTFFHTHKVVALFKDTVKVSNCRESLFPVDRLRHFGALLPVRGRVIGLWHFDHVFPFRNVP